MKLSDGHLKPDISRQIVEMQQQPSHWLSHCGHFLHPFLSSATSNASS